jgi:hypothetical protein
MLPHMTEVQIPTKIKNMMLMGTSVNPNEMSERNTGILTVAVNGLKMAINKKIMASVAANINMALDDIFAPREAPVNLPINIKNQYVPTTVPAIMALMFNPPSPELVINRLVVFGIPTSTPT